MYRQKVKFPERLVRVTLAASRPPESASAISKIEPSASPPPTVSPPPDDVLTLKLTALNGLLAELGRLNETIRTQQRATIIDVAQTAVEMGVVLAERMVNTEITADRQRLDRIIRDVLERQTSASSVLVRGHAADLALLQRQVNEHPELQPHSHLLTFRPDRDGIRGQLKLEADDWFVEWDTRRSMTELREALLEETFAHE